MNFFGIRHTLALFVFAVGGIFSLGFAATIRMHPIADTTLVETAPDNNTGANAFVNAGTSGIGTKNRGLYKFDFTVVPPNSKIQSAILQLEVTKEPSGGAEPSTFELHRMLKSWGEGDKDSTLETSSGMGFPATINEATWNSPFALTTNSWTAPGATGDFADVVSSSVMVYGVGDFPIFDTTPEMVADVQTWMDNPATNFGWLLKTESESISRTARQFGSHEFAGIDTNSPPYLEIEFTEPLSISNPQIISGEFEFSFLAEANRNYTVEFKNALGTNSWLTLTNITAPTEPTHILVSDIISTNTRFYRVIAP
jgi:hypothetical protein